MKALPLAEVYRLLEPGPVVLLTTAQAGRANAMAMSWHTMMEFEPPLVGCVVSERNHSFAALATTRECVIAVPTVQIAQRAVSCGNVSGQIQLLRAARGEGVDRSHAQAAAHHPSPRPRLVHGRRPRAAARVPREMNHGRARQADMPGAPGGANLTWVDLAQTAGDGIGVALATCRVLPAP